MRDDGPARPAGAGRCGGRDPDHDAAVRRSQRHRHPRRDPRLRRASECEGLRPDADHGVLVEQIAGPIYFRVLITGAAVDRRYAERLVSAVLDGAITPVGSRRRGPDNGARETTGPEDGARESAEDAQASP